MKRFKTFLIENMKAQMAALALAGTAMAAPPAAEMPQIDRTLQGLGSAEHRGRLKGSVFDYDPKFYIRTGGSDPSKPGSISTAYGPFQFVKSTIADLSKRHPKLFAGSEEYVQKFIQQGEKMYKTSNDPKYGYGGSGDLSGEEYHEPYMNMSRAALSAMAKDIGVDLSKPLNPEDEQKLITRFRGNIPGPAYRRAYEQGINIPKSNKENKENKEKSYSDEDSYQVQSGDSLSKIAKARGINLDDILNLNPDIKDPNKISVGQKIKIKSQPQTQPQEKPQEKPQEQPKIETDQSTAYEVQSGDSLSKIAKRQGKTVEEIIRLNPDIKDPNVIKPGQKIKIK